jgi:xylulokinase
MKPEALYVGLDFSTQSLKAAAIDARLEVRAEATVNFAADLPEFKTQDGVHRQPDGLTVTSPPAMWIAALELLCAGLQRQRFPFAQVAAVSGSGQQHGSVYWRRGARAALRGLSAARGLREQLGDAFAVAESPIWMDSSTTAQCRAREDALGGAQAVAELTGSRAYERFTGNQIAKIFQTQRAAYDASERIGLVSSFGASLLIGDYAPIDVSDGSGMNVMDIRRKRWDRGALDVTAPDLEGRLGPPVASHTLVGRIHRYFIERYGFAPECAVVAFSGDNPNSLAGLRLKSAGDVAISLGTSDTVFGSLADPRPSASEGHIFANPVEPEGYMALICYKNGSLTREAVRKLCKVGSWPAFNALVERVPPGNNGQLGFYIVEPEITPPILNPGIHRFSSEGRAVARFAPETEARAVLEGQFLSMRVHGAHIGLQPASILATGGASNDRGVLRVMADVFGTPVFTGKQANSAAVGAAYRALHGWTCGQQRRFVPFADVVSAAPPFTLAMEPDQEAHRVYTALLDRYTQLEQQVIRACGE